MKPEVKLAFFRTFDIQFGSNLIFSIAIIQDISKVFSIMVSLSTTRRGRGAERRGRHDLRGYAVRLIGLGIA